MPRRRSSSARVAPIDGVTTTSRVPSGDHSKPVDAARQVGQPPRLAAVERQQVDLDCVLAVLRRRARPAPPRRSSGGPRGRRGSGRRARSAGGGRVARRASAGGARRPSVGDEPERRPVAIEAGRDRLERDGDEAAIGRQARFGRDAQAVQVVGSRRARQGGLQRCGTTMVRAVDRSSPCQERRAVPSGWSAGSPTMKPPSHHWMWSIAGSSWRARSMTVMTSSADAGPGAST